MPKLTSSQIKNFLIHSIDSLQNQRDKIFVNPKTDFSRTQKISFRQTILFPMLMDNHATSSELVDFFPENCVPSQAAMSYRRDQIKPEAFEFLFKDFTSKLPCPKTYAGMRLVAVDGSRINTPYNPKDPESFLKCYSDRRGTNQLHLNALYDILNGTFLDAMVQNRHSFNETKAFCDMVDRYSDDTPTLFLADRGYTSFNIFAHIRDRKHHFLIRIQEKMAKNLFTDSELSLNDSTFDRMDTIQIGRRLTHVTKKLRNYHWISSHRNFDALEPKSSEIYTLPVRLLKFPISETQDEYILTDLTSEQCSIEEVKKIYHLRWGIETAFRFLKYAANLLEFHSLKHTFQLQEIYAKLTFYNFCAAIQANLTKQEWTGKIHKTKINKSYVFDIVLRFLKGRISDIESLVSKKRVSDRPGRNFKRNMQNQRAVTLNNR